jgi:hypothetical protein
MIQKNGDAQLITNDAQACAPGDFAIVRVKVGLLGTHTQVVTNQWDLVGFSFTARTRITGDHVSLVYRFVGSP